jgi:hypothetical protein
MLASEFETDLLEKDDGGTPVTCPTDPPGGHFPKGSSKAPLNWINQYSEAE